ncbi:MAG: ABC transporter permease [Verrucomicrobiae bacterium]|nr:ABC transporter permease [Verrucomicrobiae bacterium]
MEQHVITPNRNVWQKFWQSRWTRFFVIILGLLYFSAGTGPFLAPYNEAEISLPDAYHPPTRIIWSKQGLAVQKYELVDKAQRRFEPLPNQHEPIVWFVQGSEYRWFGLWHCRWHLFGTSGKAKIYLLGADSFGRDVFSRLLYGAGVSLSIGLVGIAITTTLGLILGGIAGYAGGRLDWLLMRGTEVLMSIPALYLILAVRSVFVEKLSPTQIYLMIIVILSFISWASMARVIRGMVLSLRERDFVKAARVMGQSHWKILLRHILPNTWSYVIVACTLSVPGYILGEAALSFLGLGIQDPQASWGLMLAQAQSLRVLVSFWWMLLPGVMISITVMTFNFIGDALRDALDLLDNIQEVKKV